jgi:hypothetical protein
MNNLRKWHVIVVDWYYMCKNGEPVDQLLLHFEITSALWITILSHIGLAWVMPKEVVKLFACWRGQ